MSKITASSITGLSGVAPTFINGAVVTGVITATTFISTGSTGVSLQISGNRIFLTAVGIGSTSFILS
jgi:hypothetical protein